MSLPALTPEQRTAALHKSIAVRQERRAILEDLKQGRRTLTEVLGDDSKTVTRTKVRRLLESLPGVGPIRAAQVMTELAIADGRRVQGLGDQQRARLEELFRPAA
ncbi:integration host factor, actinobacterial type [Streptomyces sp. NPDC093589]|uniref:integration host factor, actinobacterial type n=1 Tax=Streptomyces sp. NPDC093589 TaxID=3366043 RepID=UPI0038151B8B